MATRFCVIPDPIFPDGEQADVAAFFAPDDQQLPTVLGSTGIESTPVFETELSFEKLLEVGFPGDARKTGERIQAAAGFDVAPESDPYDSWPGRASDPAR
jgi:hypothetical protein